MFWKVTYDGNLPITRFSLKWDQKSIFEATVIVDDDIPSNVTSYTITALLPGLTYTFKLKAFNDAGESQYVYLNVSMPADGMFISQILFITLNNLSVKIDWMYLFIQ